MVGAAPTIASADPTPSPSPCATPTAYSDSLFTAKDGQPAPVTVAGGSTTASITFTAGTYYNYLDPVYALDARSNPTVGGPPRFEYSVNGGSWKSVTALYDPSGLFGNSGYNWIAQLPQWTNLPSGAVLKLGMKITFNSNMPAGSYLNSFGFVGSEICSELNIAPKPAELTPITYAPAAPKSPVASSAPAQTGGGTDGSGSGSGGTTGGSGSSRTTSGTSSSGTTGGFSTGGASANSGGANSGGAGQSSGSASTGTTSSPTGTPTPGTAPASATATSTDSPATASSAPKPGASATALLDANDAAATSNGSGSTLLFGLIAALVVLLAAGAGTVTWRRRRSARPTDTTPPESTD